MKNLNLNIVTPNKGSPYVKIFKAIYCNELTHEVVEGKYYTTEDAVLKEVNTFTKILDYSYLYTDTDLVFI